MAYRNAYRRAVGPVKVCNSQRPSSPNHSTRHLAGQLAVLENLGWL
jgi:hypothetical protein